MLKGKQPTLEELPLIIEAIEGTDEKKQLNALMEVYKLGMRKKDSPANEKEARKNRLLLVTGEAADTTGLLEALAPILAAEKSRSMQTVLRILKDLAKEQQNLPLILGNCKDDLLRISKGRSFGKLRGEAIDVLEFLAGSDEAIGPLVEAGLRPKHLSCNVAIRNAAIARSSGGAYSRKAVDPVLDSESNVFF
jgi:hypothetical protein